MGKNIFKVVIVFGIFGAGVIFGKQIQKISEKNKSIYSGTLQVNPNEEPAELYLVLNVLPEDLIGLADVLFKVDTMKMK